MRRSSLPPLEARVLPDEPAVGEVRRHGAGWRWLIVSSIFVGFVSLLSLFSWGVSRLIKTAGALSPSRAASLVQHWENRVERLAAIHAAMEPDKRPDTSGSQRELARLLNRLAAASDGETLDVAQFVDLDEMTDRIL